MNAHIISIGNELLEGYTIDSNSVWISQFLITKGITTIKKNTLRDNQDDISSGIQSSINEKIDYVFVTGGLGPTHDDITKESLSKLFNSSLIINKDAYKDMSDKYASNGKKNIDENSKKQAMILENSTLIKNRVGLAAGFFIKFDKSIIIVLPGVPKEMKTMIREEVSPHFFSNSKSILCKTIRTFGITESSLYGKMKKIINKYSDDFLFSFLPHFNGVDIRVKYLKNYDDLTESSYQIFINKIFDLLLPYSYGYDNDSLELVSANLMLKKGCTLSIAESCTGGLISKKITDIPGSSDIYLGGIVSYSNKIKTSFLDIDKSLIELYGAVSKEISELMAINIKKKFKTDYSIATTGISGPTGGTEEKPVGLVYISISDSLNVIHTKKYCFNVRNREMHRELTACVAFNKLRELILNG